MKLNDIVNESLTQEGMWDTLKSKFTKQPQQAQQPQQRVEPAMDAPQQNFATGGYANQQPGTVPTTNTQMPQNVGTNAAPAAAAPKQQSVTGYANQQTGAIPTTNTQMPQNMGTNPTPAASAPKQQSATGYANQQQGALPATSNTMQPQNFGTNPAPTAPYNIGQSGSTQQNPTKPTAAKSKAAEPTAAQPATTGKADQKKEFGGGFWQGAKDLFNPAARVARAQNRSSNIVRSQAINDEVRDFMGQIRGGADDPEFVQQQFVAWAKNVYPNLDTSSLQQIAKTMDPEQPASITDAIGDAYNANFAMSARNPSQKEMSPEQERMKQLFQQAKDQKTYDKMMGALDTTNAEKVAQGAASDALSGGGNKMMTIPGAAGGGAKAPKAEPTQNLEPQDQMQNMPAAEQEDQIQHMKDYIKLIDQRKEQLQQYIDNIEKNKPAKTPKVTSGGPTPTERQHLAQRVQQASQAQPQTESRDFGSILWKKK